MAAKPPKPPPPPPPNRSPGAYPGLPPPKTSGRDAATPTSGPIQAPALGETLSQASKDAITEMALGLLEEQVQARIVHYKADLETNPELDAITAQVVAQLKQMQDSAAVVEKPSDSRDAIRKSQEKILRGLLERVFRQDAPSLLVEKKVKEILRKLARLFFQSELHEKTRGQDGATKVIQHGEQALYYLLVRYDNRLKNELGGFDFASDEVKDRSFALLAKFGKDMQDAFLSRRSSELKRIVGIFNGVLVDFFCKHLPSKTAALAHDVIEQAQRPEGRAFSYKISAEGFPAFRAAFERRFMGILVSFAEDELVTRLADTAGQTRDETIKFITDPHIFSMICGELSEGLYELLCNEGFLDLPTDWRQAEQRQAQ
jgi:hypothetical protein